jgi:hypothetical protein
LARRVYFGSQPSYKDVQEQKLSAEITAGTGDTARIKIERS